MYHSSSLGVSRHVDSNVSKFRRNPTTHLTPNQISISTFIFTSQAKAEFRDKSMHTQPQLQLQPQPQPQTHPSRPVSPVTRSQTPSASQNRTTPSRSQTPPIHNPNWHPPPDTSTYRDLLLFEERLKSNAEMLRRRRTRYSGR